MTTKIMIFPCLFCKKEFQRYLSQTNQRLYCSQKCYNDHRFKMMRGRVTRQMDGWDLGIIISIEHLRPYRVTTLDMINSGVIAEMGWLEEDDLRKRLQKLVNLSLLKKRWLGHGLEHRLTDRCKKMFPSR